MGASQAILQLREGDRRGGERVGQLYGLASKNQELYQTVEMTLRSKAALAHVSQGLEYWPEQQSISGLIPGPRHIPTLWVVSLAPVGACAEGNQLMCSLPPMFRPRPRPTSLLSTLLKQQQQKAKHTMTYLPTQGCMRVGSQQLTHREKLYFYSTLIVLGQGLKGDSNRPEGRGTKPMTIRFHRLQLQFGKETVGRDGGSFLVVPRTRTGTADRSSKHLLAVWPSASDLPPLYLIFLFQVPSIPAQTLIALSLSTE